VKSSTSLAKFWRNVLLPFSRSKIKLRKLEPKPRPKTRTKERDPKENEAKRSERTEMSIKKKQQK
jgi:hypothetical protein